MSALTYLITGGFLKGHRTYILVGVAVISAAASFAVGDINLNELITAIATSLSVGTVRAAVT